MGPNFGLPIENNKIPVFKNIGDLETAIKNFIDPSELNNIRYNSATVLKKATTNRNLSSFDSFLLKKKKTVSEFFKSHPEILCMRSDKGGKTVFVNKEEYDNKASTMLKDITTYQPIRNPTSRMQKLTISFVHKIFESHNIDEPTRYKLAATNAISPLMYFLVKHHKQGMPLRPICADLNGPMRGLLEFASKILSKLNNFCFL